MFRLISIQQTADASPANVGGRAIRCIILADNVTDALPSSGSEVVGMQNDQAFLPGTIAITTGFDLAMVGNDGEWGEWS